ncbi:MAG: hypothetical protein ACRDV7_01340 [Acidimicrobiia bacterium]
MRRRILVSIFAVVLVGAVVSTGTWLRVGRNNADGDRIVATAHHGVRAHDDLDASSVDDEHHDRTARQ